jgi:DNA-binding response OmpR family regulator
MSAVARFRYLVRGATPNGPPSPSLPPIAVTQPGKRVLIVEDDAAIRESYADILRGAQYEVTTAGSHEAALALLERSGGAVDVLVLDIGLPDADGADVARDAARQFGDRPTLYVSGWTPDFWQLSDAPGRWLVLQKPIPGRRLLKAVQWLSEGGDRKPDLD